LVERGWDVGERGRKMMLIARVGCVAAIVGSLSLGVTAPALADGDNLGQKVYMCAHMMLPYDLNPGGSITMIMPDGTAMYFPTFGDMVRYMQSNAMCS
jgi:hypothetical protein